MLIPSSTPLNARHPVTPSPCPSPLLLPLVHSYPRVRSLSCFVTLSCWEYLKHVWILFLKKDYLFIYKWETERGRDTGRGRSRFLVGSLMWDLIPGLRDHNLSQRQMLNLWAPPRCPPPFFLKILSNLYTQYGAQTHNPETKSHALLTGSNSQPLFLSVAL